MHVQLGKYNQLPVVKEVDFGVYLDGDDDGEILLPARYVPDGCKPGDLLNVFIYLDNEERLVATTQTPYAQVGDFACLEVAWTNEYGAFLNWGLMKDLFVPFREQKMKMQKGRRYVVHVHIDEDSFRIMASAKVERYLSKDKPPYKAGDPVDLLIWQRTELGYKAIVDNRFSGLLYANEVFRTLEPECAGKLVSTIGHFRGGEKLAGMRELRVFEKDPRPGDYPEREEDRLLPGSDVVVITGMALTNGTMPHILELCRDSQIVALSGPSVPVTPIWFDHGVTALFGTLCWDIPGCRKAMRYGGHKDTWKYMGKSVLRK